MLRKIFVFIFVWLMGLHLFPSGSPDPMDDEKVGYVLLDTLITNIMEIGEKGLSGMDELEQTLDNMMADANQAKTQNKINKVFFKRYTRILMLIKLLIPQGSQGILVALMEKETYEFIEEVTGERPSKIYGADGVEIFSNALAEEILNLRLYLDTMDKRIELRKEFMNKFQQKKLDRKE